MSYSAPITFVSVYKPEYYLVRTNRQICQGCQVDSLFVCSKFEISNQTGLSVSLSPSQQIASSPHMKPMRLKVLAYVWCILCGCFNLRRWVLFFLNLLQADVRDMMSIHVNQLLHCNIQALVIDFSDYISCRAM